MRWSRSVSALCIAATTACGTLLAIEPDPTAPNDGGTEAGRDAGDASDASDAASHPAVLEIAAGRFHSCALLDDGSVWCWGANTYGQLGAGENAACTSAATSAAYPCRPTPTRVADLPSMAHLARPLGGEYSCALDAAGALYCWGRNDFGQLGCGDGGTPCGAMPSRVPGLPPVAQASAGAATACAVTLDAGAVYCWGNDGLGQAGNTGNTSSRTPVLPPTIVTGPDMAAGVTSVAVTLDIATCASKGSSTWCWGGNYIRGNLGHPQFDGDTECSDAYLNLNPFPCTATPRPVFTAPDAALDAVEFSGGASVECVRRHDDSLWCWGSNELGGLGNGVWDDQHANIYATQVTAVGAVASVGVGDEAVCVASEAGVQCWGNNGSGAVGTGSFASIFDSGPDGGTSVCDAGPGCTCGRPCVARPQRVAIPGPGPAGFKAVASGAAHTLALRADGTIWSWGANGYGQLAHAPASSGDVHCAFGATPMFIGETTSEWCNPTPTAVSGLP